MTTPSTVTGVASIGVTASDGNGVVGVKIYLDNSLIKSYSMAATGMASLTYVWDSTLVANGGHSLQAKATDSLGAVGSSASVKVTVDNPTVSLTAPSAATGVTSVQVVASDGNGVVGVDIYLDNSPLESYSMAATGTISLTYLWDSTLVPNGPHSLQAKVRDSLGAVGLSAPVTTTVSNVSSAPGVTYLTDANSYAVPNISRPALFSPMTDPVFGSTVARVTDPSMIPTDQTYPAQGLRHEYARYPAINADKTKMVLLVMGGADRGFYEVRGLTTGALLWKIQPKGDPEFSWHPSDPNLLFYRYGNEIRRFHVDSGMIETVMSFPQYGWIGTREEGRPSDNWRYYAFIGYQAAAVALGNWNVIDIVVVDLVSKSVIATWINVPSVPDWVSVSPSGQYVVAQFVDGSGTRMYVPDGLGGLTYVKTLFPDFSHSDFAIDANGDEVLVYVPTSGAQVADFGGLTGLASARLRDGQKTLLLTTGWWWAAHASGLGSRGRPGWVLISTYNAPADTQQPFGREIFWLALDGSAQVRRIAHHHSDQDTRDGQWGPEKDYYAEPQATASWDATMVVFSSVWGSPFTEYDLYTLTGTWWP